MDYLQAPSNMCVPILEVTLTLKDSPLLPDSTLLIPLISLTMPSTELGASEYPDGPYKLSKPTHQGGQESLAFQRTGSESGG